MLSVNGSSLNTQLRYQSNNDLNFRLSHLNSKSHTVCQSNEICASKGIVPNGIKTTLKRRAINSIYGLLSQALHIVSKTTVIAVFSEVVCVAQVRSSDEGRGSQHTIGVFKVYVEVVVTVCVQLER
jgi:hypothetical protein